MALLDVLALEGDAVRRARVLEAAGADEITLRGPAPWVAPERFEAALAVAALDDDAARRVGRSLVTPERLGLAARLLGLAGPEKAYRRAERLLPRPEPGGRYRAVEIRGRRATLAYEVASLDADPPEASTCSLRRGLLEAIPQLFGLPLARVEESHCRRRGDHACLYRVRWKRTSRAGLAAGAALGVGAGSVFGLALGMGVVGTSAIGAVAGLLGAGCGRGFDLAHQLDRLVHWRRSEDGLLQQVDSALAEKMDELAKLHAAVEEVREAPASGSVIHRPSREPEATREACDLGGLVEGAVQHVRRELPSDVSLEISLDQPLERILCDPVQIEQMLLQLLRNAIAAADASAEAGRVSVELRGAGDRLEVGIEDNGPGIDDEIIEQVFDPFGAPATAGADTGFGLPVSFRIAKAHGGELRVETTPDAGTRVSVSLPIGAVAAGLS